MLRQIKLHTIQPHLCEWLKWQKLQGQKRTKDCWGPGAERSGRRKDKGAHSWRWGQARGTTKVFESVLHVSWWLRDCTRLLKLTKLYI